MRRLVSRVNFFMGMLLFLLFVIPCSIKAQAFKSENVLEAINRANTYWQATNPKHGRAFWDNAAYHTGNMSAYDLTKNEKYRQFSEAWSEHNKWMGARSTDVPSWKYNYGETNDFVLFGDWQICFQTYIDLYNLKPEEYKVARAKEVIGYQISTSVNDYWWWVDGLYMVMPVMTKLYKLTGEELYLDKLYEYWEFTNSVMWDDVESLYYRDKRYVYPAHKTLNGKKDFWSRGNGWAFAAFAKVLQDLPQSDSHFDMYLSYFKNMASALIACQQPEGYWSRSLLDACQSPGFETSGTAFFTYGLFWGINQGFLEKGTYLPYAMKGWNYLYTIALQDNGRIGYVQPIGDKAIPGQVVDLNSTANFGVGAFLLAACETYRFFSTNTSKADRTFKTLKSENKVVYTPKENILRFSFKNRIDGSKITISLYNAEGKILFQDNLEFKQNMVIPIESRLEKGNYIVRVVSDCNEIMNQKVIVK